MEKLLAVTESDPINGLYGLYRLRSLEIFRCRSIEHPKTGWFGEKYQDTIREPLADRGYGTFSRWPFSKVKIRSPVGYLGHLIGFAYQLH
jgi:hypothetical protein